MEVNALKHYGILGMKWGVRRYQNEDGSLTAAGKKRYGEGDTDSLAKGVAKKVLGKANEAAEKELAESRHRFRMENDPVYREQHSRHPWDEKMDPPGKEPKPWDEKMPKPGESQQSFATSQKQRSSMTDAELKKRIQRLEMETKLKDLEKKNQDAGKEYAESILKDVGKRVIVTAATGAILYGAKSAVSGDFDIAALAAAIFNGGAKKK